MTASASNSWTLAITDPLQRRQAPLVARMLVGILIGALPVLRSALSR